MRRLLAMTMALGLIVTAMGSTGIFAVFTDRATTGTNHADSGTQPRVADIQLGTSVSGDCSDATYVDDLLTGVIDVSDLQPNDNSGIDYLCLRGVGTARAGISVSAIDVVETEVGCTGDEAAVGDDTCGTAGVGDGELGSVLVVGLVPVNCSTDASAGVIVAQSLSSLEATPAAFTAVSTDEVVCVRMSVSLPVVGGDVTSESLQLAQSDQVEWRFAFDASPV